MQTLSKTPMNFAGLSALMVEWPGDFIILSYPRLGEPSYVVHHNHEQTRFIAYADALDYIDLLATGGVIHAVKASPARAYHNVW